MLISAIIVKTFTRHSAQTMLENVVVALVGVLA